MTSTSQPSKVCVVCGADCAGRPRVKDPRGRYFCKPCYETAVQNKKHAKEAAAAPSTPRGCPGCGRPLATNAVLCINCGFDLTTGQAVAGPVVAAPAPASDRRATWPLVIGIISIILGAGGAVPYGVSFYYVITELRYLGPVAVSALILLLSVWLLLAAIGVVRRKHKAVQSMRRWAIVKIAIYSVSTAAAIVALFTMGNVAAKFAQLLGPKTNYMGPGIFAAVLLMSLSWFLLWPIVVLIWLSRGNVQDDVERWSP